MVLFITKKYSRSRAAIWTDLVIDKLLLTKSNHDNLAYFKETIQSDVDILVLINTCKKKNPQEYTCIVKEYKSIFYS